MTAPIETAKCRRCGYTLADDAVACPNCGQRRTGQTPAETTELKAKEQREAPPVRLVSIDDITVGQLVSFQFKFFVSSIPLAFVLWLLWLGIVYVTRH